MRKGRIYNNNKIITPDGGSDFWESGVLNPDIILQDLMIILHELKPWEEILMPKPEEVKQESRYLHYYQRLK